MRFHTESDHRPVHTILSLETPRKTRTDKKNWRTLDASQARQEADNLPPIPSLTSKKEVDDYLERLDKTLQEIANKTTQPCKESRYAVLWWN